MEAFSGYPIHESNSFVTNLASSLSVDTETLQKRIDELSTFSDTPAPSVTRVLYTENDVLARSYIKNLMGLSGLSVREDAVGNIFGRWIGNEAVLAPVATGSHIDAIPYSGKYDGVVGVLGAIEAINVLKRSGFKPRRSLEVIMFTSEEPTRYGISCLGRLATCKWLKLHNSIHALGFIWLLSFLNFCPYKKKKRYFSSGVSFYLPLQTL